MKRLSNSFILIILCVVIVACYAAKNITTEREPEIKNVILMIGDGMGLSEVCAAMTVSDKPLNIERCSVTGLQKTFSSDYYVTDSGAAGC